MGNSHMEASMPRAGLLWRSTFPSLIQMPQAACSSFGGFFGVRKGSSFSFPFLKAAQSSARGQRLQRGFFGMQISAPRSIKASLKSPARSGRVSFTRASIFFLPRLFKISSSTW